LTIGAELLVGTAEGWAAVVFEVSVLEVVFDAPVLDAFEEVPEADAEAVPVVLAEAFDALEEDAPDVEEAPLDEDPDELDLAVAEADLDALLEDATALTLEEMTNWPV